MQICVSGYALSPMPKSYPNHRERGGGIQGDKADSSPLCSYLLFLGFSFLYLGLHDFFALGHEGPIISV